jgi:hypothetical protein
VHLQLHTPVAAHFCGSEGMPRMLWMSGVWWALNSFWHERILLMLWMSGVSWFHGGPQQLIYQ